MPKENGALLAYCINIVYFKDLTPFLEKARARFDLNVPFILPYPLNNYAGAVSLYHVSQTE